MTPVVFILNGPNLNLLGQREPEVYGTATLADVEGKTKSLGSSLGLEVDFRQSNHEGVLVDWIQEARTSACGVIINAAGFTHSSVAIHDALKASDLPIYEVHISNVFAREPFRHHSYISSLAAGVIVGCGIEGYDFALQALARRVARDRQPEILSV